MSVRVIEAEYDGKVLIPKEPLELTAGTRVQLSLYLPQEGSDRVSKLRELWQYFEGHPELFEAWREVLSTYRVLGRQVWDARIAALLWMDDMDVQARHAP